MSARLPFERPLGATPGGIRVWAPKADRVAVRLGGEDHALESEGLGVWSGAPAWQPGDDYWIVLDGRRLPDPCTRFQAKGLRGPSRLVDPAQWTWTDQRWKGVRLRDLVLLELHVGTFTREGTFDAAIGQLERLHDIGITGIELMPIAAFPGERGWGYDGVYPWSAQAPYGGPDGLQRLVDAAHAHGIAVVLDIVPNHVGASGEKALRAFGPYFTGRYTTPWGEAINYDDADSGAVREWLIQACEYWVRDVHVDGLRLDAIHAVFDAGAEHVIAELARRVHAVDPRALVIAESGLNDPKVIRPNATHPPLGWGCDAQWADDFHHAVRTLVSDEREGYYAEFGHVAQLAKAFDRPFVHDGGYSTFRRQRYGAPAPDRKPEQFVVFDQNHDQVGNRAFGDRLEPRRLRLAQFCVLLSPFTPMLFMGEEYGERAPFQFFSDHIDKRIARATREGRRREFAAFASFAGEEVPDPQDPATFERSKLTGKGARGHAALVRELLAARRELKTTPPTHASVEAFDDDARWLRVRRGPFELLMNFGRAQAVPAKGRTIVVTTGPAKLQDGGVRLGAMTGALVR
ncbi:MAG: malto-oligosyltrehalose trehalohydrolase [Actinobacteria bacterium]|nr:MAG: malto-oligosyltrehalose trehalohydrolase [Actinomycetota bacterium]